MSIVRCKVGFLIVSEINIKFSSRKFIFWMCIYKLEKE